MTYIDYDSTELYALRRQWSHADGGVENAAVMELSNPSTRSTAWDVTVDSSQQRHNVLLAGEDSG
jgi:hypothetical protein